MFHVASLLPFNPDDKQRLERKRHLGNDVVLVLFLEEVRGGRGGGEQDVNNG